MFMGACPCDFGASSTIFKKFGIKTNSGQECYVMKTHLQLHSHIMQRLIYVCMIVQCSESSFVNII